MSENIESLRREVVESCKGAPGFFTESVSRAFVAIFEGDETIPVNVDNLVKSEEADAIPAQLKTAQQAAKTAETQVQNLRDTLGIASQDADGGQGTVNETA